MILDAFVKEMNQDVEFFSKTTSIVDFEKVETYSSQGTVKGFFFNKSSAERLVSEQIRTELMGAVIVRPDIGFTPDRQGKVVINGVTYNIIESEDIGLQNEVILIPLKEFTGEASG